MELPIQVVTTQKLQSNSLINYLHASKSNDKNCSIDTFTLRDEQTDIGTALDDINCLKFFSDLVFVWPLLRSVGKTNFAHYRHPREGAVTLSGIDYYRCGNDGTTSILRHYPFC